MRPRHFVPVLGLAATVFAAPAQAQLSGWPADRPSYSEATQPYYEARRGAYDNGYREGLKEGEHDARRRERFDFQDERDWQRADAGYHRSFGDRDRYRYAFRSGFEAGYSSSYQRIAPTYGYGGGYGNGRWSGGGARPDGYPQYPSRNTYPGGYVSGYNPAFENGARDGYEKGREDVRDRDSFDPLRHKWYREGDRHYEREYGPKQQYEDRYRQGFQSGYERGYREYGYRY